MSLEITKPKLIGKHMAGRRTISAVDKLEALTESGYRQSKYSLKALKCRPVFYESPEQGKTVNIKETATTPTTVSLISIDSCIRKCSLVPAK